MVRTPMLRLPLCSALVTLALAAAVGCASGEARYIDSGGPETVVSIGKINIQDWSRAADEMVTSLLDSGVLERAPQQPAKMAISRIVNNTTQQVDTSMLTKKIRVALNQSGKVVTTTTMGLGGVAEDPMAKGAQDMREFYGNEPADPTQGLPYYTLSGKLLEDRARAGSTRQTSFVFQLSLTETTTGNAVWEDEKIITKQGKKPAVGW